MAPWLVMLGAGVKILCDVDENERRNRKLNNELDNANRREKTERYTQYAGIATNVIGALGGLYLEHKRMQAEIQRSQPEPVYQPQYDQQYDQQYVAAPQTRAAIPPPPPPLQLDSGNSLTVDLNSIWDDQSNNTIGATVINRANGQVMNYAYHLQKVRDSVNNILESVNGSPWQQVGVIDFKNVNAKEFGTPKLGGPIFAEIFLTLLKQKKQQTEMLPPAPVQSKSMPVEQNAPEMTVEEYIALLDDMVLQLSNVYQNLPCVYFAGASEKGNNKIRNAIKSYALQAQNEYVIFVFDSTVFGSAEEGFLVTDMAIYGKELLEDPIRIDLEEVYDLNTKANGNTVHLNVNNQHQILLTSYNTRNEASRVVQLIRDVQSVLL